MIPGRLKWRAQERRRAEISPPLILDFDKLRGGKDALRHLGKPGLILNYECDRPEFIAPRIPAWRHIRARAV